MPSNKPSRLSELRRAKPLSTLAPLNSKQGRNDDAPLTLKKRFYQKVNKASNGCWEWMGFVPVNGYPRISIRSATYPAHRISYMMHNGKAIPDGMMVCHTCDNMKCVNPDHLFLGTQADNMRDAARKWRMPRGEHNPAHKLTTIGVLDILKRLSIGQSQLSLAREYGVDHKVVNRIAHRKAWTHLPRL